MNSTGSSPLPDSRAKDAGSSPSASPPRPPLATGGLLALGAALVLVHLSVLTRYGWFRDEFYYLACARRLDWGYVDHPPLSIAVLALVRAVFGDSLAAIRLVSALALAAAVFLTGALAREFGGTRGAQLLAALAALLAPVYLAIGHFYSMNALEILLWPAATLALLRSLATGSRRAWIVLGLLLGLGLLNKLSMLWLGAGMLVGLLLTPHRRALASPGPWIAAALAGLLFVPHVVWEVAHGWPTLEFIRNATREKMAATAPGPYLLDQVMSMGPAAAYLWIIGLVAALAGAAGRWRPIAWIYLAALAIVLLQGSARASYLSPAYPPLLALGAVVVARWWSRRGPALRVALPVALPALMIAGSLPAVPLVLPVLPVDQFIRYQARMGMAPGTEERHRMGPLPQHYADMHGWEEMVAVVARAYDRLTPEERAHAVVFGQNYGEAGAVEILGRRLGLPRAISGHNSYWLWGPGDWDGRVMIIIGGDADDNAAWFESLERVGAIDSPYAMPYENGLGVFIGRRLKLPLGQAWPLLKHYI